MKNKNPQREKNLKNAGTRGAAMLMTVVVIGLLGIMVSAIMLFARNSTNQNVDDRNNDKLMSNIEMAVTQIYNGYGALVQEAATKAYNIANTNSNPSQNIYNNNFLEQLKKIDGFDSNPYDSNKVIEKLNSFINDDVKYEGMSDKPQVVSITNVTIENSVVTITGVKVQGSDKSGNIHSITFELIITVPEFNVNKSLAGVFTEDGVVSANVSKSSKVDKYNSSIKIFSNTFDNVKPLEDKDDVGIAYVQYGNVVVIRGNALIQYGKLGSGTEDVLKLYAVPATIPKSVNTDSDNDKLYDLTDSKYQLQKLGNGDDAGIDISDAACIFVTDKIYINDTVKDHDIASLLCCKTEQVCSTDLTFSDIYKPDIARAKVELIQNSNNLENVKYKNASNIDETFFTFDINKLTKQLESDYRTSTGTKDRTIDVESQYVNSVVSYFDMLSIKNYVVS